MTTLAVGLAALLLAGCQGNPEPPPLDGTPTPSPSPSSSPTPTAPTLPPEAKGTSTAAAKAFVRHYVALVNHAMATGDTEALRTAGAPGCASCNSIADRIEGVYTAGGSIESNGWGARSIALVPLQPRDRPILDVGLELSPQTVRRTSNAEPQNFPGGRLPATFHLALRRGEWVVLDWERVE